MEGRQNMGGRRSALLYLCALMTTGFTASCASGDGPREPVEQTASALGVSARNLTLQELTNSCGANQVQDFFQVTNNDTKPVRLSDVSIKLWADDTTAAGLVSQIFYGGCLTGASGCFHQVSGVTATATRLPTACGPAPNQQANWEITITNTDSATLAPGVTWGNLQSALHLSNFGNFSPGTASWYSSCLSGSSYANTTHSALYVQGNLVTASTGVPPSCRAPQGAQPVPGVVGPGISNGTFPLVGPMPSNATVSLAISLPLAPQPGTPPLDTLIQQLYDPTSPRYHEYLGTAQFAAAYGPSPSDYDHLVGFVQSNGMSVVSTSPTRNLLTVSGPVAAIESAFFVTLNIYQRPNGDRFFAAANDPSYTPPAGMTVPILHIAGLENFTVPRGADGSGPPETGTSRCSLNGETGNDYAGPDFRNAYFPGLGTTTLGATQKIALVEFTEFDPADGMNAAAQDAASYATSFLAAPFGTNVATQVTAQKVCTTPGPCTLSQDPAGQVEAALDVEMVLAMAPKAQVLVYQTTESGSDFQVTPSGNNISAAALVATLKRIADDNQATVISNSWTWEGSEAAPLAVIPGIFQQYAAQGQSFFQASGDFGSYVPNPAAPPAAAHPAEPIIDSALMTVVGGTQLTTAPAGTTPYYQSERTWNNPQKFPNGAASGGGFCQHYQGTGPGGMGTMYPDLPLPAYQANVASSDTNVTANQAQGIAGFRMIPDVSIVADQIAGFAGGILRSCQGGTSLATPLWAGAAALINDNAATHPQAFVGPTIGFANPALYTTLATASSFNDIGASNTPSSGDFTDNNFYGGATGQNTQYRAMTGYDLATGLGSPNPNADLVGGPLPPQSCMPGSNLTALINGNNVTAFVPNGSYDEFKQGVRVVAIEGSLPTVPSCTLDPSSQACTLLLSPGDVVNTCAGDSTKQTVVCTGNNNNVYVINLPTQQVTTLNSTLNVTNIESSGGFCETCNVAINPLTHTAFITLGVNTPSGVDAEIQFLNLDVPTPQLNISPFDLAQRTNPEALLIDPSLGARGLILAPNETGNFQLVDVNSAQVSNFSVPNLPGSSLLEAAAEDCTTHIAISSLEFGSGETFLVDLNKLPQPLGSSWGSSQQSQFQLAPDFAFHQDFPGDVLVGTDAIVVASPSHLGAVTGEFGGNQFGLFQLPSSANNSVAPAMVDWVQVTMPNAPDASPTKWRMGHDPHTLTAYTSPNTNKQYAIFQDDVNQDGTRTWLAVVDMQALLFRVARVDGCTPSGPPPGGTPGTCLNGTTSHVIPDNTISQQCPAIGSAFPCWCTGAPTGANASHGCVVGFIPN